MFWFDNVLGTDQDLPFADILPDLLAERLGEHWANRLYLLWDGSAGPEETATVRYAYMDTLEPANQYIRALPRSWACKRPPAAAVLPAR